VTIQRSMRRWYQVNIVQRREAMTVIQSQWRTSQCVEQLKFLRGVVKIQSLVRRQLALQSLGDQTQSLSTINSMFRMSLDRNWFLSCRAGIVLCQSFWRRREAILQAQSLDAVICVQSLWRAVEDRNRYLQLKPAVQCLQSLVRKQNCRQEYLEEKKAAVLVQSVFRSAGSRRSYTKTHANRCLQSVARMNQQRESFNCLKSEATLLQCLWRRLQATNELNLLKALVKVQSVYRTLDVRAQFRETKNSASCVQSIGRMTCT
jgi:myosin heavy subunit